MPELPYLPKFYHTRFYNTYPAYCLGMVPITLGIQRFLDGARLYSAVMESVRFADSLAGDEFDETTYYIRFRVDAEQFLKDTGLYVGRSTIRTPLLTSKSFASYMASYLQSQGYEVTLYE